MCGVPTLVKTSDQLSQIGIVILAQLVSPSVALPAELVDIHYNCANINITGFE